ncbi:lipopolysaccharide biosynthesis protein [Psychrobacter sp. LFX-11D]|uniref:lipopolysaccharide biosynthesis protein n=1 Tax=Psychrobacter sp. LFX-11D TaxID=458201 RepID=UPI00191A9C2C|nr:oligosaccharide flippase family protein [Psychrobacter sp. LFX-11D]
MDIFKQKIKTLFQGSFVRNVSMLVGGTAFAQLITIILLPVLTRLYSPEDFGVLAVYLSFVSLISVVSCLRLEIAIPIPKEDKDALVLFVLSLGSVVVITLLTVVGTILFSKQIYLATEGKLEGYVWLIPLSVFFSGIYAALQYWATRHKAFSLVAKTRLSQAVGGSSTQIGLGYAGLGPLGLLIGQLVSIGAGIIGLSRYFIKNSSSLLRDVKFSELKSVFKQYDRFPKYSTWEAFANSGAMQIPVILIAYYAVSAEAGFLMLAMRLLSAPMSLIGGAVGQVYLAEASEKNYEGQLRQFTHNTVRALAKIGTPTIIFAGMAAPFLIPIIFGKEWQRAGILIAWMSPWFLMQFITSPVSMALHITNNPKIAMLLQFFGLLLRVGGVVISGLYYRSYIVEVYAITGFIFYSIYLFVVLSVLSYLPKK